MNIDWKRIAKPQPDQYDSLIIGSYLHQRVGWIKSKPELNCSTICDGTVAVVKDRCYTDEDMLRINELTGHDTFNAMDKWNDKIGRAHV